MVYVALGELVLLAIVIVSFVGLIRSLTRAHARREDLILDKMLHSAGVPWTPPPADTLRAAGLNGGIDDGPGWTVNPELEV